MLVVARVKQLHHCFLIGFAVVLMWSYDFVVEMGLEVLLGGRYTSFQTVLFCWFII